MTVNQVETLEVLIEGKLMLENYQNNTIFPMPTQIADWLVKVELLLDTFRRLQVEER